MSDSISTNTPAPPPKGSEDRDKKTNDVKVFVGNLDFKCTSEDLSRLFAPYGTVIGVNLRTDRHTGRPKGFGFVTFTSVLEAEAAISALHGSQLHGRVLTVNTADVRGSKEEATAKPEWVTTPTPRPEPVANAPADPNVKDYSGVPMTVVGKAKKGKKKASADGGGGGGSGGGDGAAKAKAKLWTSWAGPA